ncbi:Bax inhibitor-1/YccA family protein [Carnobacterium gallinarum]|uniref:Bax inhibitor-1/YccA family protein n=1 Tax=Carnobacterium gallinarum TaxID=2749 RepID=UPI000555A03E|nr:Bax inhibitor-1/YccA family protein [Carnobacterium gallinarum]
MNNEYQVASQTGLGRFFAKVYAWVAAGLFLSAATSFVLLYTNSFISQFFWTLVYNTNGLIIWGFVILEFILVFSLRIKNGKLKSTPVTISGYILYSVVSGITLSVILLAYTDSSILNAFLSTVVTFGGMSLLGFVTKKDLSGIGGALLSALLGLIIASVVNLVLLQSETGDFILSIITVIIFSGLTAYDTQKCKVLYAHYGETEMANSIAINCALELYLDFINIFIALLRIFGKRR